MIDTQMMGQAFALLLDWQLLWLIPAGLLYGVIVGAIPGMTASLGIALVMPFTFHMTAIEALVFLSSIFTGGVYGGSITAIILNMPGSPASAATGFDGFAMARNGQQNEAQGYAIGASALGSLFAAVLVLVLLKPIATFALMFGPVEMLMVGVFALTIVASFKGETLGKGILAGGLGLLLGTVGVSWGGVYRATFGNMWLIDGLPVVPVILGILAMPGLFALAGESFVVNDALLRRPNFRKQLHGMIDSARYKMLLLRSTLIGVVVGALPAAGSSVASLVSWHSAKQSEKNNTIGDGDSRGVIASESANNASEMGSTAVMLALGIPGGGATAIMLGAFLIHGLTPGPRLLAENLDLGYAVFLAQFLQVALLPIAGLLVIAFSTWILKVPNQVLVPIVLAITCWGVFATRETFFDIGLLIGFGLLAYVMQRYGYPPIALLLGIILSDMLEPELIRAVATFDAVNLPNVILTRPIPLVLVLLTIISLYYSFRRRAQVKANDPETA
ncbi:tripartite tricarboxylate transporter permease [Chelativorans sp. Marseille-P2723]|uniref:tripartite tricarboxylate transporter permease n=1 Tax=Chelativorans sp. Marseille-P2723 TaxID=2709133 RepID=UPI00156D61E8|nr:tripartite tricarboxylate transporter permease [Chelativorans sp. Marseille-P2723]